MSTPSRSLLIPLLIAAAITSLLVTSVAAYQLFGRVPSFVGTPYPDPPPAPDFALVDHRGEPASLSDHRGKAVLLFFGFTRCPDVCPLTLGRLSRIVDEAGLGPDRVSVLLLTVDPEYDTPERLAEFLEPYSATLSGITGDAGQIEDLLAEYGVYALPALDHHGHRTLAHTSLVFGVDRGGRLRVLIHADNSPELVERDIRTLLRIRS